MLNVITVLAGPRYRADYVTKMHSMVERNLQLPFKFYCITDRPDELPHENGEGPVHLICPPELPQSWWSKLFLFSNLMPPGDILYLDLDQVIVGDITDIITECLKRPFSCYADHIEWGGMRLGTALMTFPSGSLTPIFDLYWPNRDQLTNYPGGDQLWIAKTGLLPPVFYLDDLFPNAVQSYKFDILLNGEVIQPDNKIINFHGIPKVHQVAGVPFVKEHWR